MTLDDFIGQCSSTTSQRRGAADAPVYESDSRMETRLMSQIISRAGRRSGSAGFAAVAVFVTSIGVATLASAQVADTCPPEHRKMDKKIHDLMHRRGSDREPSDHKYAEREQSDSQQQ